MSDPAHETLRCPQCRHRMLVGHVAVSQGLHWLRRARGPYGDFREAIPGTHAILRPNRLPAWKCNACELILFRFGNDVARQTARQHAAPSLTPSE